MKKHKSNSKNTWIFGRHAVIAAIESGKREIIEVHVASANDMEELELKFPDLKLKATSKEAVEKRFTGKVHQGICALVGPLPTLHLEDVMETSDLILLLDQITDPHNFGAILRSANAFGCGAVVVPKNGSAPINEIVAKTAAGALEDTPVITVSNLNSAIKQLQENSFWCTGLDGQAKQELKDIDTNGKVALVMGNEGSGLRRLVAENCDHLAKLPMTGTVESLNVSVATAIALYEIRR